MISVFVLTPYRADNARHDAMLRRCIDAVRGQTHTPLTHLIMPNAGPYENRYDNMAAANDRLLRLVPPWAGAIFIDHDIVDMQPDAIAKLVQYAEAMPDSIIAPQVVIEAAGNSYDGLFYDIGCFQTLAGDWATNTGGVPGDRPLEPMASVGVGMYLPPGYLRYGASFWPKGDEIEKVAYSIDWRNAGGKIFMARDVTITHANLPAWGEAWH